MSEIISKKNPIKIQLLGGPFDGIYFCCSDHNRLFDNGTPFITMTDDKNIEYMYVLSVNLKGNICFRFSKIVSQSQH